MDFFTYALSLTPTLLIDARLGDLRDRSGYGNHGSATSSLWRHHDQGFLLAPNAGRIQVANAASLQMASGTWLVWGDISLAVATQYLIAKYGVSEAGRFYISGAFLVFYDGASTRSVAHGLTGKMRMAGVTFVDGDVPKGYVNGALVGAFSGAIDIDPTSTDAVSIGASAGGTLPVSYGLATIMMLPSNLTPTQITQLDTLWQQGGYTGRVPRLRSKRLVSLPPGDIDTKCTEVFPGKAGSAGTIVGEKGVSVGTRSGFVGQYSGSEAFPQALQSSARGLSNVACSNPASLLSADNGAIEAVVQPGDVTNIQYIARSDANTRTYLYQLTLGRLSLAKGNPQVNLNSPNNSLKLGVPYHAVATWWLDGATRRMELFLDGVSLGTSTFLDGTVVADLQLLSLGTSSPLTGKLAFVRTYDARILPDEARRLYLQYASASRELSPNKANPVTLANVAAAGYIGPWLWGSGTWSYQDDGTRRKLVNVVAGWVSSTFSQAWGAWYFRAKKLADGNAVRMMLIGSSRESPAGANQNGYEFRIGSTETVQLLRITGGVAVISVLTSGVGFVAYNVEYEFFVTRRYDGLFTVYIRGGAFTTWTLVASGPDTAYTTSSFTIVDNDPGDELSELTLFALGGTLTPNDLEELADAT